MCDEADPVAVAVFNLALAADTARTSRIETALLEAANELGATTEDLACAVAHAAGSVAQRAPGGVTLLAAMFCIARLSSGRGADRSNAPGVPSPWASSVSPPPHAK